MRVVIPISATNTTVIEINNLVELEEILNYFMKITLLYRFDPVMAKITDESAKEGLWALECFYHVLSDFISLVEDTNLDRVKEYCILLRTSQKEQPQHTASRDTEASLDSLIKNMIENPLAAIPMACIIKKFIDDATKSFSLVMNSAVKELVEQEKDLSLLVNGIIINVDYSRYKPKSAVLENSKLCYTELFCKLIFFVNDVVAFLDDNKLTARYEAIISRDILFSGFLGSLSLPSAVYDVSDLLGMSSLVSHSVGTLPGFTNEEKFALGGRIYHEDIKQILSTYLEASKESSLENDIQRLRQERGIDTLKPGEASDNKEQLVQEIANSKKLECSVQLKIDQIEKAVQDIQNQTSYLLLTLRKNVDEKYKRERLGDSSVNPDILFNRLIKGQLNNEMSPADAEKLYTKTFDFSKIKYSQESAVPSEQIAAVSEAQPTDSKQFTSITSSACKKPRVRLRQAIMKRGSTTTRMNNRYRQFPPQNMHDETVFETLPLTHNQGTVLPEHIRKYGSFTLVKTPDDSYSGFIAIIRSLSETKKAAVFKESLGSELDYVLRLREMVFEDIHNNIDRYLESTKVILLQCRDMIGYANEVASNACIDDICLRAVSEVLKVKICILEDRSYLKPTVVKITDPNDIDIWLYHSENDQEDISDHYDLLIRRPEPHKALLATLKCAKDEPICEDTGQSRMSHSK